MRLWSVVVRKASSPAGAAGRRSSGGSLARHAGRVGRGRPSRRPPAARRTHWSNSACGTDPHGEAHAPVVEAAELGAAPAQVPGPRGRRRRSSLSTPGMRSRFSGTPAPRTSGSRRRSRGRSGPSTRPGARAPGLARRCRRPPRRGRGSGTARATGSRSPRPRGRGGRSTAVTALLGEDGEGEQHGDDHERRRRCRDLDRDVPRALARQVVVAPPVAEQRTTISVQTTAPTASAARNEPRQRPRTSWPCSDTASGMPKSVPRPHPASPRNTAVALTRRRRREDTRRRPYLPVRRRSTRAERAGTTDRPRVTVWPKPHALLGAGTLGPLLHEPPAPEDGRSGDTGPHRAFRLLSHWSSSLPPEWAFVSSSAPAARSCSAEDSFRPPCPLVNGPARDPQKIPRIHGLIPSRARLFDRFTHSPPAVTPPRTPGPEAPERHP